MTEIPDIDAVHHFDRAHLTAFILRAAPLVAAGWQQGPLGDVPLRAAARLGSDDADAMSSLPSKRLTRVEVTAQCQAPLPVLHGYLCVMAWGDQIKGPQMPSAIKAWAMRERLATMLEDLRTKVRSRGEAFDLFCGTNAIEGLAPAYFTKLITFFAPHLNGYILDQFTGLSINKLSAQEEQVVQMSGSWVNRKNTGAEYEAFCSRVDRLAEILNHGRPPTQHIDGYRVESLLFGKGQPWRDYIDTIYQRAEKRAETRRRAAARKKASAEA